MEFFTELATGDLLGRPAWLWLSFLAVVAAILVFDLGVLHKRDRAIGAKESLLLSGAYAMLAGLFGLYIWWQMGSTAAAQFYTGYVVEWSLSLDNVFVISLIFTYFAVPREYQHRVLFWGILGAIVMRGIMIGLGAALVQEFGWVMYIFGAFLLFTGVKMLFAADDGPDIAESRVLAFLRRVLPVTARIEGDHFFIRQPHPVSGKISTFVTPLFLALIMIEIVDLVFAVDSVPAIFAITTDPFIVYTSNIFAILGLRTLYFSLAVLIHRFHYLKYALAAVLIFIGAKIFYMHLVGHVDPVISLGVTVGLLAAGVIVSLVKTRDAPPPAVESHR